MTRALEYDIALCGEAWYLFKEWLLLKLHLKTITMEQRFELKRRKQFLQGLLEGRTK